LKYKITYLLFATLLIACKGHYIKQTESFTHTTIENTSTSKTSDSILVSCQSKTVAVTPDKVAVSRQNPVGVNRQNLVDMTLEPYKLKIETEMNRIIAHSTDALTREGNQSTLGNFVCDAMHYAAITVYKNKPVDIVLVNRGGLRNNLPTGNITVGNVFELMPFENELVLVEITGKQLLSGLKTILAKKHSYYGLNLVLSFDSLIESKVNQRVIQSDSTYSILTSDYLATGGDNFNFLSKPVNITFYKLLLRDAIISYCEELTRNKKHITPYRDKRLYEYK
jgi:2',3'-cyclic-nucleotide 2'-phosphodiesterase (5'-nucleotidase family)